MRRALSTALIPPQRRHTCKTISQSAATRTSAIRAALVKRVRETTSSTHFLDHLPRLDPIHPDRDAMPQIGRELDGQPLLQPLRLPALEPAWMINVVEPPPPAQTGRMARPVQAERSPSDAPLKAAGLIVAGRKRRTWVVEGQGDPLASLEQESVEWPGRRKELTANMPLEQSPQTGLGAAIAAGQGEEAWVIYQTLRLVDGGYQSVPLSDLHSLFALVYKHRHNALRTALERMEILMKHMRRRDITRVEAWQRNMLMVTRGQIYQPTTPDDYTAVVEILRNWFHDLRVSKTPLQGPTIDTYNILLDTAYRTNDPSAFQDAHDRWKAQEPHIPADRFTYLLHLMSARSADQLLLTLQGMLGRGFHVGTDGANALILFYALPGDNQDLDVAMGIYDVLVRNWRRYRRRRDAIINGLKAKPRWDVCNPVLSIPPVRQALRGVLPGHRTHIILIQQYASRGELEAALQVFKIFLRQTGSKHLARRNRLQNPEAHEPPQRPLGLIPPSEAILLAAFRGLFVGFARYQTPSRETPHSTSSFSQMHASATQKADQRLKELQSPSRFEREDLAYNPSAELFPFVAPDSPHAFVVAALAGTFQAYTNICYNENFFHQLPPVWFVRWVLTAFKNVTARLDVSSGEQQRVMRVVWQALVRDRFEPCAGKWEDARNMWVWTKVRRDFGIDVKWERRDLLWPERR